MNKGLSVLIVDDEALACDMLEYLLVQHVPVVCAIKKITSAAAAVEILKQETFDIFFLDVQMPFLNGFELLSNVPALSCSVIFTTAYNNYAIRAIRFSALDYLLKPVDVTELKDAVQRHRQNIERQAMKIQYENFARNINEQQIENYKLAVRDNHGMRLVKPAEIIRCVGRNNYTKFFLRDKTSLLTARTIKEYEEILTEHWFIRTHKSHLVNTAYISRVTPDFYVELTDGSRVELSRRKKDALVNFMKAK